MVKVLQGVGVAAGGLIGSAIVTVLTGTPVTSGTWVVAVLLPLAMLGFYWIFIEPPQRKARIRGLRFRDALEDSIRRVYIRNPANKLSEDADFEDTPDFERR